MTEDEVKSIVSGAIDETEKYPVEEMKKRRAAMALWLWKKFKIAIKETVVSFNDGLPYLKVQYENNKGKIKETTVSLEKYKERIGAQMGENK